MAARFKYIIIGRGMMGAAAARHLSQWTDGAALIGPPEPEDRLGHDGVFASHYDEARITRTFDGDLAWGTFAARSLDRYAAIEEESGIRFYTEAGCLFAGPEPKRPTDYLRRALDVSDTLGLEVEEIAPSDLQSRFPQFSFAPHLAGFYEHRRAGHINPRALIKAQAKLAAGNGATLIDATVTSVRDAGSHVEVICGDEIHTAEKVLVAAGAFTNFNGLLPRPVDMRVAPRTVVFYELGDREAAIFGSMPSTIVFGETDEDHVYILPPVGYPDGRTYLKLGGDTESRSFERLEDIVSWFHSEGDSVEREKLAAIAEKLMPALAGRPVTSAPCVASFTPSSHPYIGYTQSRRIAVLTGGNFVAAKSSDELGRLGAVLLRDGEIPESDFGSRLAPAFR
ncbi:FAD-dependent oxidoreductase [Rhizobium sp. LC145]|uniref:NAD(P)/FAD-dependent oxidoreductase n=1 Tax=Rhizobium sp. LC145 TaxID=1120688 RepID=UPI00062A1793|nr:FAD-dependent oxidoreductase [Rhizobium sp. LC145]KKX29271.1 FAD-dependent oxidoreductase [Rhizobium sp. LC145]TKT68874.1 FAD-dependent oxidoreductase [Rhizobiaceae bacterium LC148]